MPTRQILNVHTVKDTTDMRMYWHNQGNYLAVMNQYMQKKTTKYSVELFDTKSISYNSIPHQQIVINREVSDFHSVVFEPNQGKFAIHMKWRKVIEGKQFSNDPYKNGCEVYQIKTDALLGFNVKQVGVINSDKVYEVYFSCAGNILCTIEQESGMRYALNFYYISKISNEG